MKYWTIKLVLRTRTYISYIISVCSIVFCVSFASLYSNISPAPLPKSLSSVAVVSSAEELDYEDLLTSIVRINNPISGGSGSGVIVWQGFDDKKLLHTFILTNNHVVQPAVGITVDVFSYLNFRTVESVETFPAALSVANGITDLAIIEVISSDIFGHVAELISSDDFETTQLYSTVYIVGCGLGNPPFISEGGLIGIENNRTVVNGFSIFGCSGGGVFNEQGKLLALSVQIGIASIRGIDHPITNISVSIPINVICDWLLQTRYKFILSSELGSLNDIIRPKKFY